MTAAHISYRRTFVFLALILVAFLILLSGLIARVKADSGATISGALDNTSMYPIGANYLNPQLDGVTCDPSASIQLGSVSSSGVQADVSGNLNSLTSDGRYLYFPSRSAALVANDTNNAVDYFEFDRTNCQTRRITVGPNGEQGDGNSDEGDVSGNGQYFVFASKASTFVAGDTNNKYDIFVKNLQTGAVTRIAVDPNNTISTTYYIGDVSISDDGRYITFDVLVSSGGSSFVGTPILYDLQTATRTQIAVEGRSLYLSGDGQYIAFVSSQSDLVPDDTNGVDDIFVYERATGTISRISVMTDGTQSYLPQEYPAIAISSDGRYVSFTSMSSMASNDTNSASDVYIRDRQTNQTTLVSVNTDGSQIAGGALMTAVSADGRYVFFIAASTSDLTVRDRQANQTYTITSPETSNGGLEISDDGQYLAFSTLSGTTTRHAYVARRAAFAPAQQPTTTPTPSQTYTPTFGATSTPSSTPSFSCSLLSLSNNRLYGNEFRIDIQNNSSFPTVISRVEITWPNIPAFAQTGLTQMSLDTYVMWTGSDLQNLSGSTTTTDTDTKPGYPPFSDTPIADRQIAGQHTGVFAAAFNGPPNLAAYVSENLYTISLTLSDPLNANSPCVLLLSATYPTATPTFEGHASPTPTPTPDCVQGLVGLTFHSFDSFGIVRFNILNQNTSTITLVGFNINWQKYVTTQRLAQVSLGAPPGLPGAVLVWDSGNVNEDAVPSTNSQTEGTWLSNFTLPPGIIGAPSLTPIYFDFGGIYRYDDASGSVNPLYGGASDFNASEFDFTCDQINGQPVVQVTPAVLPTKTPVTPTSAPNAAPPLNFFTTASVTLTWNRVSWATGYQLQISTDKNFAPAVTNTYTLPSQPLSYTIDNMANGTYYWRVMARGSAAGQWSAVGTLVVSAPPAP